MSARVVGSKKRLVFLLLLAACIGRVWPHEGEDHTRGATLQTQTAGPNQSFQVSLAHLPDAPIAGQTVKFLARLEETTASDDPLLGGRTPMAPRVLEVSLSQQGQSAASLKAEPAGEAGVYRFEHLFSRSGRWGLLLRFQNAAGIEGQAEFFLPVKAAPGRWTLPLLQGIILAGCLGLVIQRFVVSPPRRALASSLVVVLIGSAGFAVVTRTWPASVPPAAGDLTVEVFQPAAEQVPEATSAGSEKTSSQERVYESPAGEPVMVTGTVQYASNRLVAVSNPSPGTIVYKQGTPEIGDWVRSGQVLAVIQNRFNLHDASHLLNLRWDLVKTQLRAKEEKVQAETAHQRDARLFELGIVSGRQLQAAQSRLNLANTASREADDRLKLHDSQIQGSRLTEVEVKSPINGYISRAVYPSSGQMIFGGEALFEIVDPSVVWVEMYALPQDLQQVEAERTVTLRSAVFPDRKFRGKLLEIRADTDPVSRAVRVLYEVQNPDRWLKAGMLLSLAFGEREGSQQAREKPAESRVGAGTAGGG